MAGPFRYNTGNPVEPNGSSAPPDLFDNSANLDFAMNRLEVTWVDRLGRTRRSWYGIERGFDEFLLESGYAFIGDYDADGPLTITEPYQIFSKDGEFWRVGPGLVGQLPYITVDDWTVDQPKMVSVGDAALRQQLAGLSGSPHERGGWLVDWHREAMSRNVATVSGMLNAQVLSVWEFAHLATGYAPGGDPSTWDWGPAFTEMTTKMSALRLNAQTGPGIFRTSVAINIPVGLSLFGAGSGTYTISGAVGQSATILMKINSDTDGNCVVNLGAGAQLHDVLLRPQNESAVTYYFANYPAGTGNCSFGAVLGRAARCYRVTAEAFATAGFHLGVVSKCIDSMSFRCNNGFLAYANDGELITCGAMFCHSAGADVRKGFWKVLGGRWEWNARYGIIAAGEGTVVGCTFDRNGWSGLYLFSGYWGNASSGNYFARNGCGGNGTAGRWSFSVPGHPSYLETAAEDSSHVRMDFQRRVALSGNVFRHGRDDTSSGCDGPRFIYSSGSPNGATQGVSTVGNCGDQFTPGVLDTAAGYNKDYPGGGAIAGGTDAILVRTLGYGFANQYGGVSAPIYSGQLVSSLASSSVSIRVPRISCGKILLSPALSNEGNYSEIIFSANLNNTALSAIFSNVIGSAVLSASMSVYDSDFNEVIVELSKNYFVRYEVLCV